MSLLSGFHFYLSNAASFTTPTYVNGVMLRVTVTAEQQQAATGNVHAVTL